MAGSDTSAFRSIPIDFEVFKELTARLEHPADTYNDVLRRELGLGDRDDDDSPDVSEDVDHGWVVKGVRFLAGTQFRARHKGRTYQARVEDGALLLNGQRYRSPSAAATSITHNAVNGWRFWECRFPGESRWHTIAALRP